MHAYRKNYPRPQLVRESWELLDGQWDFMFDDSDVGEKEKWYCGETAFTKKITVPYTYETKLSGIGDETIHNVVWYQRSIMVSEEQLQGKRLLLHFEGMDFYGKVWVNGQMAGAHKGAYARASFDITDYVVVGENKLVVRVWDSLDPAQPRGKQRWKDESYACWYVQTTGIWKSVWMEYTGEAYVKQLKITPCLAEKKVSMEVNVADAGKKDLMLSAKITFGGQLIQQVTCPVICGNCKIDADLDRQDLFEWGVQEWRPEWPSLYDVELKLFDEKEAYDEIASYFGLREIRIDGSNILLNGTPLYQRLILDQGYWRESHLTPPDEDALIKDIDAIMAMGYNGVRKHQKIEDERFLYWCDVKGLLVWSEMGAAYRYSDDAVEEFTKEWMEIVKQNYSHPCIITWTPFNESWGVGNIKTNQTQQHFTEAIYYLTKSFDPYRPVIVNDGWEHTISDILTLHDYEEKGEVFFDRYFNRKEEILENTLYHCGHRSAFAEGYGYKGQPIIISEFGGIAFNEEGGWGYGNKVKDAEDFIRRFDDITTAIKKLPYVCGFCYTQVSDVQQEINGLMDEERNFKIQPEILKEINERRIDG